MSRFTEEAYDSDDREARWVEIERIEVLEPIEGGEHARASGCVSFSSPHVDDGFQRPMYTTVICSRSCPSSRLMRSRASRSGAFCVGDSALLVGPPAAGATQPVSSRYRCWAYSCRRLCSLCNPAFAVWRS